MDAREVAMELKREVWYAGGQIMTVLLSGSRACGQNRETEECVWLIPMSAQEAVARSHPQPLVGVRLLNLVLQRFRPMRPAQTMLRMTGDSPTPNDHRMPKCSAT